MSAHVSRPLPLPFSDFQLTYTLAMKHALLGYRIGLCENCESSCLLLKYSVLSSILSNARVPD